MFQIINLADLFTLWEIRLTSDLHFHISRLETGDLSVLPGDEPFRPKLYAIQLDTSNEPFLLFKSMYQPAAWTGEAGAEKKGWLVIFSEEFARTHQRIAKDIIGLPFLQVPKPLPLALEPDSVPALEAVFAQLSSLRCSSPGADAEKTRLLHELFLSLRRQFNRLSKQQPELLLQVKQAQKSLYIRFKNLLEKLNFKSPQEEFRHLSYYAETLEVSTHSLNKAVKRFSGHNALRMIHEKSLTESKILLRSGHMTMKEISVRMAFRDPTQFGIFFKKYTGISPAQFRENLRRWC
ncbi:MAG: helix-turn-helix domain-containing protein [Flavihumibacter sp.]